MKLIYALLTTTLIATGCSEQEKNNKNIHSAEQKKKNVQGFFPVTDFLNGQIALIKAKGINPLKIVRIKGRNDSSWVKMEGLQEEFSVFLSPVIDSVNLSGMFMEKSFLDQTIHAFTFTYDPIKILPDSFPLQRWDVYVDPQKNNVTRIYMVKKTSDDKTLQLTWQADKWCKTVFISAGSNGSAALEKEVTIKWDF